VIPLIQPPLHAAPQSSRQQALTPVWLGLLIVLGGVLVLPSPAQAGRETSPCVPGLESKGYVIRDVDNNSWYDEIDVTTKDGRRLELDVRRSDCLLLRERSD
jgi:hypothetical protein